MGINRRDHHWLDVLSDGQLLRDWLALAAPLFFGSIYWFLVLGGAALSIALMPVLIGFPLFLFMLSAVRTLAALDHQVMTALLDEPAPEIGEDVDPRGANLGERLGMYLGSGKTWRSLVYLALTLPVGAITFSAAMLMLPIMFIELLILAPLTIDMRMFSARLLHFLAVGKQQIMGLLLPKQVHERDVSRLETAYRQDVDERFVLGDDGELYAYKAKR